MSLLCLPSTFTCIGCQVIRHSFRRDVWGVGAFTALRIFRCTNTDYPFKQLFVYISYCSTLCLYYTRLTTFPCICTMCSVGLINCITCMFVLNNIKESHILDVYVTIVVVTRLINLPPCWIDDLLCLIS